MPLIILEKQTLFARIIHDYIYNLSARCFHGVMLYLFVLLSSHTWEFIETGADRHDI